jgi:hypothetical protein
MADRMPLLKKSKMADVVGQRIYSLLSETVIVGRYTDNHFGLNSSNMLFMFE